MSIIKSMKSYFRCEMHQKLDDILDNTPEAVLVAQTVVKRINLLKAMHMIKGAWAKFPAATIQNCWKGGFTNAELTDVIISLPPPQECLC